MIRNNYLGNMITSTPSLCLQWTTLINCCNYMSCLWARGFPSGSCNKTNFLSLLSALHSVAFLMATRFYVAQDVELCSLFMKLPSFLLSLHSFWAETVFNSVPELLPGVCTVALWINSLVELVFCFRDKRVETLTRAWEYDHKYYTRSGTQCLDAVSSWLAFEMMEYFQF